MAKRLILLSAISLLSFLFGCINYEQELFLNADGSGTAEIHYWFAPQTYPPESNNPPPPSTEEEVRLTYEKGGMKVFNLKIYSEMKKISSDEGNEKGEHSNLADGEREKKYGISPEESRIIEQEVDKEETEWKHVRFSLGFNNVSSLAQVGLLDLADVESSTWQETPQGYTFTEKISPNQDYSADDKENYSVSFTVNMPGKVTSASEPGVISGNKVTWSWNLKKFSMLGYNFAITCTCDKPAPENIAESHIASWGIWFWVAIGGAVLALIIVVLILLIVVVRRRKRESPKGDK